MDVQDECIDKFFLTAKSALEQENNLLEKYFSLCKEDLGLYKNRHHGFWILFETTMAYLTYRELLKKDFPLEVEWEEPYPKSQKKADLMLKQEEHEPKFRIYIE